MLVQLGQPTTTTKYLTIYLQSIKSAVRSYHDISHLDWYTRANIINLGIRRQPNWKPYRRSRGGKGLIGHIFGKIRQVDYNNLTTITISEVPLSRWINLAHINARSVCNKKDQIQEQIVINKLDLCTITETWIKQDDSTTAKEILPPGYSVSSSSHQGNRADGGTALIY